MWLFIASYNIQIVCMWYQFMNVLFYPWQLFNFCMRKCLMLLFLLYKWFYNLHATYIVCLKCVLADKKLCHMWFFSSFFFRKKCYYYFFFCTKILYKNSKWWYFQKYSEPISSMFHIKACKSHIIFSYKYIIFPVFIPKTC